MPELSIVAVPAVQFVAIGTDVSYEVRAAGLDAPNLTACEVRWFVRNDPEALLRVSRGPARPLQPVFEGPRGKGKVRWTGAPWSVVGKHVVVCRVTVAGAVYDAVYPQRVVGFEDEVARGPVLAQHEDDAYATLDALERQLHLFGQLEKAAPTVDAKRKQAANERERFEHYRDRLAFLLEGGWGKGFFSYALRAEHVDRKRGTRTPLRVFAVDRAGSWLIVDWTNPADPAMSGRYEGSSLKQALADWDADNRYPSGAIDYAYGIPSEGAPLSSHFSTDGASFTDSLVSALSTAGLVAGVVALAIAPIPGSQVAAFALASAVFSGSAAAVSLYDRRAQGVQDGRADVLDTLTVVSSLAGGVVGAAVGKWRVCGKLLLTLEGATVSRILVADLSIAAVQGVLVAQQELEEFQHVAAETNLTPQERVTKLMTIVAAAAANGALLYVNYRGTRAQLEDLRVSSSAPGPTPEQNVETLKGGGELDATKPTRVDGHTQSGEHETRVHVDEDQADPHGTPRASVRRLTVEEALRRAMGHQNFEARLADVKGVRAAVPEAAQLTDLEIVAIRGYTSDKRNPEIAEKLFDYERINRALRTPTPADTALLEAYIGQLKSALQKLPASEGPVHRIIKRVTPDDVRAQFVEGKTWDAPSFMSTSRGEALDSCRVTLFFKSTRSGRVIAALSEIPSEREVLFMPGSRFTVKKVMEWPGFMYVILEES